MRVTGSLLALVFIATLYACGGGGGDAAPAAAPLPPATSFSANGQVTGLGAGKTVTLANFGPNGQPQQSFSLTDNGAYSLTLAAGIAYDIGIQDQPFGQICAIGAAKGVANANIANLNIACADNIFKIAGSVRGLASGAGLVLQQQGGEQLAVAANGAFQFVQSISGTYAVSVKTQPLGQTCTVVNGTGTVAGEVNNIVVSCEMDVTTPQPQPQPQPPPPPPPPQSGPFTITVTASGIGETAPILSLNGRNDAESLLLAGFGHINTAAFRTRLPDGAAYNVTVRLQPLGQTCTVNNGSGIIAGANVTDVELVCTPGLPGPPVMLNVTYDASADTFNFTWNAGAGDPPVAYWLAQVFSNGLVVPLLDVGIILGTSVTFKATLNGVYVVQAFNGAGLGPYSAPVTAIK